VPGVARGFLKHCEILNKEIDFLAFFTPGVSMGSLKKLANLVQPFGQL